MKRVGNCFLAIFVLIWASAFVQSSPTVEKASETETEADKTEERTSYVGAQVINLKNEDIDQYIDTLISKGEAEKWGGNATHFDVFVSKDGVESVKTILNKNRVNYQVKVSDVQAAIDEQNPPLTGDEELDGRKGHKLTWRAYHRLSDIYGYLDYLSETYPNIVTVGSVGNSVEGRPIKFIKISSGNANAKKFWIDGGIHAREWISPAVVTYLISEFVENRQAHEDYVQGVDFYIIPVVNPDGYEYTHLSQRLWRKNRSKKSYFCPGVDLNRNWGFRWGGLGTSTENCREIYRGTEAFSEPETRAVSNFILNNKNNMEAFVTFHSYGQYILIPFGYDHTSVPEDYSELKALGDQAAAAMRATSGVSYQVGNSAQLLYPASGGADDWAKGAAKIKYTYTFELRDQGTYGFTLPARYIIPTAKETLVAIKEIWKETEVKLVDKICKLEEQLRTNHKKYSVENDDLNSKLKKAFELVQRLEKELERSQDDRETCEKVNGELRVEMARVNSELDEYKKELKSWSQNEKDRLLLLENNALLQRKLSQSNTEMTRKQTEIIRLNGEIGRLRGELEKIRLGSVISHTTGSNTVTQLQAALAMERENSHDIAVERDNLSHEVVDLRQQLKEMEIIVKRSKPSNFPMSESYPVSLDRARELGESNAELTDTKQVLKDLKTKYERDVYDLSQRLRASQREVASLKHIVDESKPQRRPNSVSSVKEDAHLLATIRGLKTELAAREKDIVRLNKDLEDSRKTNKRLQKEREKALNGCGKLRGSHLEKPGSRAGSVASTTHSKDYNPVMFENGQEALLFLKNENRSLKEEMKRLEQDLISLHNKRIQDLSDLQEQHEGEISRLVREHAAKHSTSTIAHLQSQLYTQQMVIHHLKEQIKVLEERLEEQAVIKTERDHLETTLIEANKKIAKLHELASPESLQYSGLMEKLEFLERRHEVREQKLQSIVRDLMSKQKQGLSCSSNCRDKLLNKNREICYYRAEMDKILATLAEFRWN